MNRSMINATNTMTQLQQRLDLVGSNLANVNTVGYKKRDASFSDMLYQQITNQSDKASEQGRKTPLGIRQGAGAFLSQTKLVTTQGSLQETGRQLDVALTNPNVFFQVQRDNNGTVETYYTKSGSFYLTPLGNGEVQLVNADGNAVLDSEGNIISFSKDFRELQINKAGELTVVGSEENEVITLGLTRVNRPQSLEAVGLSLFKVPDALNQENSIQSLQGDERMESGIQQGVLEQSNVDMSKEITDMTLTQRAYQFNSQSISIADQMMGLVNSIR
ncbi:MULTISPECIES: flagellar hook-basal body protein [Bacillaceae]|uniref:flagellar hook-basal body protein n=1 Tax=Bacillaceae TaxID=186817 RepID=UPI00104F3C2F|nr:flagellar hook-basal body protein [Bacillus sp. CBEL-1]TDB51912.1 flagellar hook-basal body protein [Bacillus sp. CBEL-1]